MNSVLDNGGEAVTAGRESPAGKDEGLDRGEGAGKGGALAKSERLRINEIFHSLQGEADAVGFPTVFVRLTGCPLL